MALAIIDRFTGNVDPETGLGILSSLYPLAVLIPGFAVSVRRLHDTGRNGWWLLVNLVPVIGAIIFLYFMVIDGDSETNEYGPSPKADEV